MPKEEKPIEFQAIRPFGPTIIRGKLSDSLVKLLDDKSSKNFLKSLIMHQTLRAM